MPRTAVGLFEKPRVVDQVVREIECLGIPRNEVQVLDEPRTFEVSGVMSFARLDFEVELIRELIRIGATKAEAQAYIDGLRRGGALVFATASADDKVDAAAGIMNRYGAVEIEENSGPEPHLHIATHENAGPAVQNSVMTGRIRQPEGGASMFVW